MNPDFWLTRWQDQRIGFHQPDGHPLLSSCWPELALTAGTSVLVPLCGKSRDMHWLAHHGHPVTGVELSPLAARDFFAEAQLQPAVSPDGGFLRQAEHGIEILVGDFFDLPALHRDSHGAFFDRAALIALPGNMRARYVETLTAVLCEGARGLLVTIDYAPGAMDGPPFAVDDAEVHRLFEARYSVVRLTERETTIGHGDDAEPTPARETLYRLVRR